MKGDTQLLVNQVLGSNNHYHIPVYQRRYSWVKAQLDRLISDCENAIEKQAEGYFLGSLILDSSIGINKLAIIDGQQRMTTISLFLIALRDYFLAHNEEKKANRLNLQFLVDQFVEAPDHQNRLHSVPGDEEEYVDVLYHGSTAADSLFKANYEYFARVIDTSKISADDWYDFLVAHITVMVISIQPGDDAQLIFESLNSTGLDLTESDKIRNYLLMSLEPAVQAIAFKEWQQNEATVGRENLSSFYRDYLTSLERSSKPTREKDVYNDYRSLVGSQEGFDHVAQLKTEHRFAKYYAQIHHPNKNNLDFPELYPLLHRLSNLGIEVVTPFLMQVADQLDIQTLSVTQTSSVLSLLLSYLARRLAIGIPTTGLNQLFATLNRTVHQYMQKTGKSYELVMAFILTKKVQPNKLFPTEDQLREALETKDYYHVSTNSFWFIMDELNNVHGEPQDLFSEAMQHNYSIEHIMPQTLTRSWQDELGPSWKELHLQWVHRLANLTLTGFNSAMSNHDFIEKRDMKDGYRDSGLKLNQWIAQRQQWQESDLLDRQEDLFKREKLAWPAPEPTEIQDPDAQGNWEILADGEDYMGWKIDAFTFGKYVDEPVATWKELVETIGQLLWKEDSTPFYKAAENDSAKLIVFARDYRGSNPSDYAVLGQGDVLLLSKWVNNNSRIHQINQLFQMTNHSLDELSVQVTNKDRLARRFSEDSTQQA